MFKGSPCLYVYEALTLSHLPSSTPPTAYAPHCVGAAGASRAPQASSSPSSREPARFSAMASLCGPLAAAAGSYQPGISVASLGIAMHRCLHGGTTNMTPGRARRMRLLATASHVKKTSAGEGFSSQQLALGWALCRHAGCATASLG